MTIAKKSDVIMAMRSPDRIMVTLPRNDVNDIKRFHLLGLGKEVTSRTFISIFDNLQPIGDGLFEDISQTYGWRPE